VISVCVGDLGELDAMAWIDRSGQTHAQFRQVSHGNLPALVVPAKRAQPYPVVMRGFTRASIFFARKSLQR
jgi:hypothetical protein